MHEGFVFNITVDALGDVVVDLRNVQRGEDGLRLTGPAGCYAARVEADVLPYARQLRVITRAKLDTFARQYGFTWREQVLPWIPPAARAGTRYAGSLTKPARQRDLFDQ